MKISTRIPEFAEFLEITVGIRLAIYRKKFCQDKPILYLPNQPNKGGLFRCLSVLNMEKLAINENLY